MRCGVLPGSVARWESGERVPEPTHLLALAAFLAPDHAEAFAASVERAAFEARLEALLDEDPRYARWACSFLVD
jgi:hypothetical protein